MSKYRITLEGKTYEMEVELVTENAVPQSAVKKEYKEFKNTGKDPTVRVMDPSIERKTESSAGMVMSPMPGIIIKMNKAEGDIVKSGECVLILEAMKMENEILSPVEGRIVRMNCVTGETVSGGEVLFEVKQGKFYE